MEITPTTLVLVGVVCVILGFIASLLLNALSEDGEAQSGGEETPPGGRKGRYTPVARLWRERGEGTLVVEMDGKSFVAPDPLDTAQRDRLERTARDLRAWLGMGVSAPEPPAAAEQAPDDPPALSDEDLGRALGNIPAAPPVEPQPKPVQPRPAAPPPRTTVTNSGTRSVPPPLAGKEEAAAPSGPKSIVNQIDDILQDMIAGTPLASRGLKLIDDPVRGVVVEIGLNFYEGIESVPDEEVKAVIRKAVSVWESRQ